MSNSYPPRVSLASKLGMPAVAPRPSTINTAHDDAKKLAEQKWAARVAELVAPTLVRPALTTQAESDNIRRRFSTPDGALAQLEKVANTRLAWLSARDGFPTATPINESEAVAAGEFFAVNGAYPAKESDAPVAPQATPAQVPATPPAQTPKPAQVPAPINPATLEIDYVSPGGFACKLTLSAPTGPAVLESARVAEERLLKFGATPRVHAAPSAPSGAGESESADPPKCKYHGGRMKLGKGNKWFCPKKVDDGYCDYTVAG